MHKNSLYIGKFFTLLGGFCGHSVANRYQQHHSILKYFGNYDKYPADLQKAIDNNDARYGHRWLQDNYTEIQLV